MKIEFDSCFCATSAALHLQEDGADSFFLLAGHFALAAYCASCCSPPETAMGGLVITYLPSLPLGNIDYSFVVPSPRVLFLSLPSSGLIGLGYDSSS